MQQVEILCPICKQKHEISVTEPQLKGAEPVHYQCPALDRRYRLNSFFVDTTRNFYSDHISKSLEDDQTQYLKYILGNHDFENKLDRWIKIDYPNIGLIDEYPDKIHQIIYTYSAGYYYPAVTSSCCLTERILNRLILKTRKYFKHHDIYKRIYRKDSFDDWDKMLKIIDAWRLIPKNAVNIMHELKDIRHQSIHYKEDFDFESIAPQTINKLIAVITEIFGVLNRKDIYLIFDIPGAIWVRSELEEHPFVKEFVLPFCYYAHAVHEIDSESKRISEKLGKTGKLTDAEFVELRKSYLAEKK